MHVVATAGHVDHGKSTLVRALTGMEPDRWAEEHRRGMTIDLGYAWTNLPSGEQLAFVDVPGHQRFIANMLAGIGPTPAVLFVVAADEGWSRQSEEHLAAVDALGVRHGVLAVTRSDLTDPAPALAQARDRMARTSLGALDGVAVSGATGTGLTDLRQALDRLIARLPAPDQDARMRLWIDRSFTIRGSGTVVTGTLSAGTISVGDTLELHGHPVSVRALQTTGTAQQHVAAVARVGVNLRTVKQADVGRGDALLTVGAWHLTAAIDVRLSTAGELPAELVLHIGTAAVPVHVRPLGEFVARLTLRAEQPIQAGDRAVLRDPGRQVVAAGVVVLDTDPPALTRRGAAARRADALADATGQPDVFTEVVRRGAMRHAHLERLGVPIVSRDGLRTVGDWFVLDRTWQAWVEGAGRAVDEWASGHPLAPGIPAAALRRELAMPDDDRLLAAVVVDAGLVGGEGRIGRPGIGVDLDRGAVGVRTLVQRLREQPFAAPERGELDDLRLGVRELTAAQRAGLLVRVSGDIVLRPDAVDQAVATLRALPQPFTTSDARQALGTTRRVAIPLLEHLDALGVTQRLDPRRRTIAPPLAPQPPP